MKNTILNIICSLRINNILIACICCLISIQKLEISVLNINAILGTLIVLLLMMGMNIFNDIFDIKTDTINRPNRPLVLYPHLKKYFISLALILSMFSIGLSFFLNHKAMIIVFCSISILIAYTPIFKKILFLGNIIIAFFLGLVFIFIEIAILKTFSTLFIPAIIAFFISLIREIIKDVEDYNGDKLANIQTFAVYFGVKKTIYLSVTLISFFITGFSYFLYYYSSLYLNLAVFLLVFFPLFYLIFFLIKSPTANACSKASNLLKKITILGLLIIYII